MDVIKKLGIKPKGVITPRDVDDLTFILGATFQGFKIKFKNESALMKVLSFILFFNKRFFTNYTTTIGSTVYFPSRQWFRTQSSRSNYTTLLHEAQHIYDHKRWPILFELTYLLVLPAFFSFRALWEWRAYKINLWVEKNTTGAISIHTSRWLVRLFRGPAYLFMLVMPKRWWRRKIKNFTKTL